MALGAIESYSGYEDGSYSFVSVSGEDTSASVVMQEPSATHARHSFVPCKTKHTRKYNQTQHNTHTAGVLEIQAVGADANTTLCENCTLSVQMPINKGSFDPSRCVF